MGCLKMADNHPVANIGPTGLTDQIERQPFVTGKAYFMGSDDHGCIHERHKANIDVVGHSPSPLSAPGASSSAADTRRSATSLILRFWFIAVRRSNA